MDLAGLALRRLRRPGAARDLTEWNGETWPECKVELGMIAWFDAISDDLDASGLAEGKTAFAADILSSFWLFGAFEPLPGRALVLRRAAGFDDADYLSCRSARCRPRCAAGPGRGRASGVALTEVRRTEMYVLYESEWGLCGGVKLVRVC